MKKTRRREGAVKLSADGVILYCNGYLAEMLGRPLDQVMGTALRNHLPPADHQALDTILAQAGTEPIRAEINLKSSDDRLVPVYLSASRLHSEGTEMVFCLALSDLTEKKHHAQTVAAERLARLILEQAAEAIVVCDEQGQVIRASQAARLLCDGDPLRRPFADLFPLRTDASIPFHLASVLQGETLRNVDVALDRQGQELDLILNAGPLVSGQQILGCVVTLTDITARKQAETARRASEQRFRTIFETEPECVKVVGPKGDLLEMNAAGLAILEAGSVDEVQSHGLVGFILPEYRAAFGALHKSALGGNTGLLEFEVTGLRGTRRWLETHAAPLPDADGRVMMMLGITRDITERKRAEETLRESEKMFRTIFEEAPLGIALIDSLTGSISEANLRFAKIAGRTRAEMATIDWMSITHPDDVQEDLSNMALMNAGKIPGFNMIKRYRRPDGSDVWINMTVAPLAAEHTSHPRHVCMIEDITERKQAEAELRLQSAALNAAANIIVITDRNGTIEWVNLAFTALTGYGAAEAIGKNQSELVKSDVHDPLLYRDLWNTILAGHVWHGEMTNRRKDGSVYTVYQTITSVKDARGEIGHFIMIQRDLTEQKRLEAQFLQAQKMEVVGRLASGIAHDFNNLLTVINGTADLALTDLREGDPLRADLQQIGQAGQRAASLTRQLLAFSRQQIMKPDVLNLSTLVADLRGLLQRLIGEDVALVVMPAEDVGNVMADSVQIEQVVMNLAVNARDAMPDGGTLTIETRDVELDEAHAAEHPSVLPGPHVMLAISDTGAGMDEATRKKIFEPFFTTKGLGQGTGLGLSTVYGIVKQSGGSIWVSSELGKGSTFKIYLPRVEAVAHKLSA